MKYTKQDKQQIDKILLSHFGPRTIIKSLEFITQLEIDQIEKKLKKELPQIRLDTSKIYQYFVSPSNLNIIELYHSPIEESSIIFHQKIPLNTPQKDIEYLASLKLRKEGNKSTHITKIWG